MGTVRIIGGALRSRKIEFPDDCDIRPTKDFIRERVFNWLGNIADFVVFDFFAGSGAWGFECLSRGAKKVYFVDTNPKTCQYLSKNIQKFDLSARAEVLARDTILVSKSLPDVANLITLDPPFAKDITPEILKNLQSQSASFAKENFVYLELPKGHSPPPIDIYREGTSGLVSYYLIKLF